jgi:hypothetical protein
MVEDAKEGEEAAVVAGSGVGASAHLYSFSTQSKVVSSMHRCWDTHHAQNAPVIALVIGLLAPAQLVHSLNLEHAADWVGTVVGAFVGKVEGEAVGAAVGKAEGATVGIAVGVFVGLVVGAAVGEVVGFAVGEIVGATVGVPVGEVVGTAVGA